MALTVTGALTAYTEDLAQRICMELASGKNIETIGKIDGLPSADTIYNWTYKNPAFASMLTLAREKRADALAEQTLKIADEVFPDPGAVGKANLQVKTRQWIASKHAPKTYGDATTLRGDAANPITIALSGRLDELEAERLPVIDLAPLPAGDKGKDFL